MKETTAGRAFYEAQIRHLEHQDLPGLMSQYHDDAVLVGLEFAVRGRAALQEHFRDYLERLGRIRLVSTDRWQETGDAIFFEATVRTDVAEARVYDVFILRDGKATHQFTGVIAVNARSFPT